MAKKKVSKKTGGARLARSKVVTIRLDPKLRYLAELAARSQRRTVSSFIEWAVERAINEISMDFGTPASRERKTLMEMGDHLWHVDEAARFVRLAVYLEHLMLPSEQLLWELCHSKGLLEGAYSGGILWRWDLDKVETLVIPKVQGRWDELSKAAQRKAEELGYQ